jgi:polygalacturonase
VPPATFNVKDYGAKGNGTTVDSPAIDKAIAAASAATFPCNSGQSVTNSTSTSGQALRIE